MGAPVCGSCKRGSVTEPATVAIEGYRHVWNHDHTKRSKRYVRLNLCAAHLSLELDDGLEITRQRKL